MFVVSSRAFVPRAFSVRTVYGNSRIGCREVVGHGINGCYNYKDDAHFPFPAVRFMEDNAYLFSLRQKEKGNWKCLTCEEKKALYRASFCQTFSEFQVNTGIWKFVVGCAMFCVSFGCWGMMFAHFYVNEPLPEHISYENQKKQLRRMLELHVNPIDGLSSQWDYKYDNWKSEVVPQDLK